MQILTVLQDPLKRLPPYSLHWWQDARVQCLYEVCMSVPMTYETCEA